MYGTQGCTTSTLRVLCCTSTIPVSYEIITSRVPLKCMIKYGQLLYSTVGTVLYCAVHSNVSTWERSRRRRRDNYTCTRVPNRLRWDHRERGIGPTAKCLSEPQPLRFQHVGFRASHNPRSGSTAHLPEGCCVVCRSPS